MKKFLVLICALFLGVCLFGCNKDDSKVIKVCASEIPHAEILENVVKKELEKQGYKLEVTILDWSLQNQAVSNGDYDANYFQHIPYLESDSGASKLAAFCKVHYEPLGIYKGKLATSLEDAKTIAICNDTSNAIRALELLQNKGVLDNIPVNTDHTELTFNSDTYQSGNITIKLISEELLAASLNDYDVAVLPCNTALTAHVNSNLLLTKEDDPSLVSLKANVLAARINDYKNNEDYKKKIDALVEILLSTEVSNYVKNQYDNKITCDASSQIDLRNLIR